MTMKINDNGTDRNMTEAEETAHLEILTEIEKAKKAQAAAQATKAAARQAVLDKLGLTTDEAAALLG
jgi:hypothetical protein